MSKPIPSTPSVRIRVSIEGRQPAADRNGLNPSINASQKVSIISTKRMSDGTDSFRVHFGQAAQQIQAMEMIRKHLAYR